MHELRDSVRIAEARNRIELVVDPLTTAETEKQVKWWIKREQERYSVTEKFLEDQQRLNLQKKEGILCAEEGFKDITLCIGLPE